MGIDDIKFDHVGFAVKDIAEAIKWYAEVLGFSKLMPPGICKMDLMGHKGYRCMIQNNSGVCLELEQRTDISFPDNHSPIISHFSINVDDIEGTREQLKQSDNVFLDNDGEIADKPDKRIMYMTGLDGIRIEIIQNIHFCSKR